MLSSVNYDLQHLPLNLSITLWPMSLYSVWFTGPTIHESRVSTFQGRHCTRVKCPCALTEHHAMKVYWENGGISPHIYLGTRWWVLSFTPRPLYHRERAAGTNWIGGWVGPRASLDTAVKRKISSPRRDSNTRSSGPSPLTLFRQTQITVPSLVTVLHSGTRTLCAGQEM
jgi:hypothetical protein